ncbi:hypothetical protein GCM10009127_02990 [Alteraurantiacibacter aestuarii]|uniref:Acyltransferase n=1 Tax=Alteraurantiacibacter aestuarii TaxID=650004 RepID=A0A844ZNP2_9SPHN|nr:acyltransferase family protein [Alteraurantiacibacter aestuarii]MXO88447.1 acyltransferase [Alteraurantiacibacter aestuarii]
MAAKTRNQNVELLRIAAAFGIVQFHAGAPGAEVGYAGLIVFVAMSCLFEASSGDRKSGAGTLAQKLLVPWAFWLVIYGVLNLVVKGRALDPDLPPLNAVLMGTGAHLWFLPFIFTVLVLVGSIKRAISARTMLLASVLLALVSLATVPWWRSAMNGFDAPVPQWIHAMPAVFIGLALGSAMAAGRTRPTYLVLALALLLSALWQVPGVSTVYLVGGGSLIAALVLPQLRLNVRPISDCMYGVYLVHLLALAVFNRILGEHQLLTVCATFLASLAGVWFARKYIRPAQRVL